MAKEDEDILDLIDDQETEEAGETGSQTPSRGDRRIGALSKGLNDLRTQFSEIKGILLATAKKPEKEEVEKPEFASQEEEMLWTLTQHSKSLEKKVSALEAEKIRERQDTAFNRAAASALKGVDFGEQADFARQLVVTYMKSNPDAGQEEINTYARQVAKLAGKAKSPDKTYTEKKAEDRRKTERPGGAGTSPPKQSKEDTKATVKAGGLRNKNDVFGEARAKAMARLAAMEE